MGAYLYMQIDGVIWDRTWTRACTGFVSSSLRALQWCMLLACTLQVHTQAHARTQTHRFFFHFWSLPFLRSYKHIQTRSPRVCELYVQSPEEQLYRCGFQFFLSELSELTHSLICLSGFSSARLCVRVREESPPNVRTFCLSRDHFWASISSEFNF